MATYGFRLNNVVASYNMTTQNLTGQINHPVLIAVSISTSATPTFVVPVETSTGSPSTGSTLVPSESSVSQPPSYSSPSPDIVVILTSTTTTVPYVVPVTATSALRTTPIPVSTLPDTSKVFAEPSSNIDVTPSSTIILPTTSSTHSLLSTPGILQTKSTITPSYIVPTTLTTISSSSLPTQSSSNNDPASENSTTPALTTSQSSPNHLGTYIGAAIGGAVFLILLILALVCLSRRRKRKHPKHHPDRPAFIGGYELKLDKVGDLQRVVHEKRVRRKTFEAWKKGVVPDIEPDDVAGKSEFNVTGGSTETGGSNSLVDVALPTAIKNGRGLNREEGGGLVGDDHDGYVVSPIEEEQREGRPVEEEQKPKRPISGITPLIFEWERRADSRSSSPSGMIGQAL